jgi:hypothetical protein
MNVLFLAVSAGGGHLKASEVIKNYIQSNCSNSQTYIVDVYKYVSPIIDKLVIGSYLKTLKNSPKLWGKIYELAEKGDNVGDLSNTLNKIFSFKIKRLVKSFKPDVIVCTHPFPLQMACNLKKNGKIDIPIINIITDYATHSLWINEYVDAYIHSTIKGYATTSIDNRNINILERHADYVLLPVWMVCYDYKQSEHVFAMNGQTGKIVGKPPLSKGKIAGWFAGISAVSFIVMRIITLLLGGY